MWRLSFANTERRGAFSPCYHIDPERDDHICPDQSLGRVEWTARGGRTDRKRQTRKLDWMAMKSYRAHPKHVKLVFRPQLLKNKNV